MSLGCVAQAFGGAFASLGTATLATATFTNNSASLAGYGNADGGALYALSNTTIVSSLFNQNRVFVTNPQNSGTAPVCLFACVCSVAGWRLLSPLEG